MRHMKLVGILAVVGAGCATGDDDVDSTNTAQASQSPLMEVSAAVQHDMSQPLRNAPAFTAPARSGFRSHATSAAKTPPAIPRRPTEAGATRAAVRAGIPIWVR